MLLTDRALTKISEQLGHRLGQAGSTLATAESCTGGFIAKVLTDIAGSSGWFLEGFVTYSNAAKQRRLGVPAPLLRRHGAVSEAVARAMAKGALRASGADAAVAVTGIAGPGGATPGKPVGTVWFAWAERHGRRVHVRSLHKRFQGGRDAVRRKTVRVALLGVTR